MEVVSGCFLLVVIGWLLYISYRWAKGIHNTVDNKDDNEWLA